MDVEISNFCGINTPIMADSSYERDITEHGVEIRSSTMFYSVSTTQIDVNNQPYEQK